MDEDKISVISIEDLSSDENQKERSKSKEEIHGDIEPSAWNMCHVFSVLAVCAVFLSPVCLIPRTNSIIYQSKWYEFNFVIMWSMILAAAGDLLNVATYFKEKSILSFRMFLKTYILFTMTWTVPYIIAYLIWCQYLKYNWPFPFLGYNYFVFFAVRPAMLWISFPRHFRANKDFRQNFWLYCSYIVISITFVTLTEGISILFKALPGYLQWSLAFLIPLMKHFETFVQSRIVNKMSGGQEEASKVLLGININSTYAFFIAVKLTNAEPATAFFIIVVDFFLHLKMTHKIFQLNNFVSSEAIENESMGQQRMVTKLVLAELIEGMTPLVYAMVFSMAYYGFNGTILRNVRNDYWGAKPVEDVGNLLQMMFLLFGVDVFSVLVNSFILTTLTSVNLFREFCRIIKEYWYFIAIQLAVKMMVYFATRDINLGMDSTGEWDWITNDGRISLIYNSTDLSNEEKSLLLNASIF